MEMFKNYHTISDEIKNQIEQVRNIWSRHLGKNLLGMYLHGSMALECFREGVSDLDILIVCGCRISREQRLAIAADILKADGRPCPLEISALWFQDLWPWKHPAVCQFHYSDCWTETYQALLSKKMAQCFLVDQDFEDPDIACHVKLVRQCGIRVCGLAVDEAFPEVPESDFWQSISNEIEEYDFYAYHPHYFASNILILGRILSYKKVGRILSKYEGGRWTLAYVPEEYRYIIERALQAWYENIEFEECRKEDLDGLRNFLIQEIKA